MDANDATPGLTVVEQAAPGGALVLALTGYVDLSTAQLLGDAIDKALTITQDITIDLSGLTFLDSTGLRELVIGYRRARAAGIGYRITGPQGSVLQVLRVGGLLAYLSDGVDRA
jgi:anti-sigma B factor antagonist